MIITLFLKEFMTLFRGGKCNFIIKKNLLKFVLINVLFFFLFKIWRGPLAPRPSQHVVPSIYMETKQKLILRIIEYYFIY